MIDNSINKQCAVQKAFGKLVYDKIKDTHLLYDVYKLCTLRIKLSGISNTKVLEYFIAALHN